MKRFVNRNAYRYRIFSKLEAGVVLSGAETKAIKTRGIQLGEAIVQMKNGEFFLTNAVISPYPFATDQDYDSRSPRKLLLKKKRLHGCWLNAVRN